MRHFYIRKAVILAVRTAGLGMLVPALLTLGAWYIRQMHALARVVDSIRP